MWPMNKENLRIAVMSAALLLPISALAAAIRDEQAGFRPITRGGLVSGTSIHAVTQLGSSGPGSLTEAAMAKGHCL
jgi:hypothetical protein